MERTLTRKLIKHLTIGLLVILVLATPILYFLTTYFYAEDLLEIVETYGIKNPDIDLSQDVMAGVFIQFFVILGASLAVILLIMQLVPKRLWKPFQKTLAQIKTFKVEKGALSLPQETGIREFSQLNTVLNDIMQNSVRSYQVQKEFTENASHELQTPLAILQNKLDNLLQDEHLTKHQAQEIVEMYQEVRHMSNLGRNLLMLSKIENRQFGHTDRINLCKKVKELLPRLETLVGNLTLTTRFTQTSLLIDCNKTLLESLINNLVVNAVRHNRQGGSILMEVAQNTFTVTNTSDEQSLDSAHIFSRFYRTKDCQKGNGLGLAIVKSICDYHKWQINYHYQNHTHTFKIRF